MILLQTKDSVETSGLNIHAVRRERNLGFVGNVNQAFAEAAQTGRLVSETDGGERAAQEIIALAAEVDALRIGRMP